VVEKRKPTKLERTEYALFTVVQVGLQPNNMAVKAFRLANNQ
jgi:hypothetical protein